jgi:hypothetical protein
VTALPCHLYMGQWDPCEILTRALRDQTRKSHLNCKPCPKDMNTRLSRIRTHISDDKINSALHNMITIILLTKISETMKSAVLTAVKISMLSLWVVTPCRLVSRYRRFGESYCLHLQSWRWRQYVSPKRRYLRVYTATQPTRTTSTYLRLFKVL